MGAFFAGLLTWFLGLISKRTPPPSAQDVENQDLGAATQTAATDASSAKTEAAIAQAEAQAPKTQDAVVTKLRGGTF
jgi:tRNA A37 threonylcarbamoyltransferase TsaD